MPFGLQIVGPRGGDAFVLAVAACARGDAGRGSADRPAAARSRQPQRRRAVAAVRRVSRVRLDHANRHATDPRSGSVHARGHGRLHQGQPDQDGIAGRRGTEFSRPVRDRGAVQRHQLVLDGRQRQGRGAALRPVFYDADPAPADDAIDFVLRMSQTAIIQRRCGPAGAARTQHRSGGVPRRDRVLHRRGRSYPRRRASRAALQRRPHHDGRSAHRQHGRIPCRRAGRSTLDVEAAITAYDVQVAERQVILSHTSTLRQRGWLRR